MRGRSASINTLRKKGKGGIASRLKALADESRDASRDVLQYVKGKLVNAHESLWFGSELLFITRITKRGVISSILRSSSSSNSDEESRFLVIVRRKDAASAMAASASSHLLFVLVKNGQIDVNNAWELRIVRGVDADENCDLILNFDSVDYSRNFTFSSALERDECLWIIVHYCKFFCSIEVQVGYTIDLDAIGYGIATSGMLNRFPLLQKLANSFRGGVDEDEADAEELLEELQWLGSDGGADTRYHSDIQKTLAEQSDKLDAEIRDFLFQWEDDSYNQGTGGASESLGDTSHDVLHALTIVENELLGVDEWISEQLDSLWEVQLKLRGIKEESGSLEAGFHNLHALKDLIETIISYMDINEEEESALRYPWRLLDGLLGPSSDLSRVDARIADMAASLAHLQGALTLQPGGEALRGVSASQWRQLQAIAALSAQRLRLQEVSSAFCAGMVSHASQLFDGVLKHKSLHNEKTGRNIAVKQFHLSDVASAWCEHVIGTDLAGAATLQIRFSCDDTVRGAKNELLGAQKIYHDVLLDLQPLLDPLFAMDASTVSSVSAAYVKSTQDRLYQPLLKQLFKDLAELIAPRHAVVNYSNVAVFNHSAIANQLISLKLTSKSKNPNAPLAPWAALGVALALMGPVLRREQVILLQLFGISDDASDAEGEEGSGSSTAGLLLGLLFDTLPHRLEKLTEGSSEADGLEALAMLTTTQTYIAAMAPAAAAAPAAGSLPKVGGSGSIASVTDQGAGPRADYTAFYASLLGDLEGLLMRRLAVFFADQIAWLAHQRGDAKRGGVLLPVSKFPTFVLQVREMCRDLDAPHISHHLYELAKELFGWVMSVAQSNDKYTDVVKMQNFAYLHKTLSALDVNCLAKFIQVAQAEYAEAETSYVTWMVQYEFPSLAEIAGRLEGLGGRVKEEEVSAYIRRKDVVQVAAELTQKKIEECAHSMRKRLNKHLQSQEDIYLELVPQSWARIKKKVVGVFTKLEEAAAGSYQLSLSVSPAALKEVFDKFK